MRLTDSDERAKRWYTLVDGQRLRELRHQRGMCQRELAGLAGVSAYTVSQLERHQAVSCRTRTLARLAAALGENPSAILLGMGSRTDRDHALRHVETHLMRDGSAPLDARRTLGFWLG